MTTGIKLAIAGVIVAGVTGYMAYLGAAATWQYYVTVDECLTNASSLGRDRIRVNGKVVSQSLQVAADRTQATFQLAGTAGRLHVTCQGPLPDNLKEDIHVVVEGRLNESGALQGDRVMTRCASKYQSQQPATMSASRPLSGSEGRQ